MVAVMGYEDQALKWQAGDNAPRTLHATKKNMHERLQLWKAWVEAVHRRMTEPTNPKTCNFVGAVITNVGLNGEHAVSIQVTP